MAQLRLTSKGLLIFSIVLGLIFFGIGFGLWALTGPKTFNPTGSDAAGSTPNNCVGVKYSGCDSCPAGYNGTLLCTATTAGKNPECNYYKVCGDTGRYQCCDGSWSIGTSGQKACGTKGYGNCTKTSQACWCKQFVGCGRDCTFPSGTQKQVDQRAAGTCGRWMAFCEADAEGNTTVRIGEAGSCWNERSLCKNPAAEDTCTPVVNVCDGGSVTSPAASSDFNVGDTVTLKGYAFDADGINKAKIVVKVDGAVAGNATATNHTCASATADAICTAAAGKPAVDWTYTYTVTVAGAHTFAVSWEDTKGLGGANCQGSRSITANIQGNPEWEISKAGTSVCLDETAGQQRAKVSYTITVKNVGNLAGQLTDLVDTQDSKMKESYITDSSITPAATVSGRVLTWDLDGAAGQFDPNETKTFKYSAVVPESAFGTFTNTVVATPDSGDTFQAVEVTIASCNPVVPETALFDSVVSKVVLAIILIGASAAYLYSDGQFFKFSGERRDNRKEFEDRVAGE